MPVLVRYVALQIPGWSLASLAAYSAWNWWAVSWELALGALACWVAKDFMLYPFVRKAYALGPSKLIGPEQLVGSLAVADDALTPGGYVRVQGERWQAESSRPVAPGANVRVRAVRGLTLQVEPADDAPDP